MNYFDVMIKVKKTAVKYLLLLLKIFAPQTRNILKKRLEWILRCAMWRKVARHHARLRVSNPSCSVKGLLQARVQRRQMLIIFPLRLLHPSPLANAHWEKG